MGRMWAAILLIFAIEALLGHTDDKSTFIFGIEVINLSTVQRLTPAALCLLYFSLMGLMCQRVVSLTVYDTILSSVKPVFFKNNLEYSMRPSSVFEFSFLMQDVFRIPGTTWIFNVINNIVVLTIPVYVLRPLHIYFPFSDFKTNSCNLNYSFQAMY